jgi:hypothetical protein
MLIHCAYGCRSFCMLLVSCKTWFVACITYLLVLG